MKPAYKVEEELDALVDQAEIDLVGLQVVTSGVRKLVYEQALGVTLCTLYVHPDSRRRGLAQKFMERFVAWADAEGVFIGVTPAPFERETVRCPIEREKRISKFALLRFYRSFGFRVNGVPGDNLVDEISAGMVRIPSSRRLARKMTG